MAGAPGVGEVNDGVGFVVAHEEAEVAAAGDGDVAGFGDEAAVDAPDDGDAGVDVFADFLQPGALLLGRLGAGFAEGFAIRQRPEGFTGDGQAAAVFDACGFVVAGGLVVGFDEALVVVQVEVVDFDEAQAELASAVGHGLFQVHRGGPAGGVGGHGGGELVLVHGAEAEVVEEAGHGGGGAVAFVALVHHGDVGEGRAGSFADDVGEEVRFLEGVAAGGAGERGGSGRGAGDGRRRVDGGGGGEGGVGRKDPEAYEFAPEFGGAALRGDVEAVDGAGRGPLPGAEFDETGVGRHVAAASGGAGQGVEMGADGFEALDECAALGGAVIAAGIEETLEPDGFAGEGEAGEGFGDGGSAVEGAAEAEGPGVGASSHSPRWPAADSTVPAVVVKKVGVSTMASRPAWEVEGRSDSRRSTRGRMRLRDGEVMGRRIVRRGRRGKPGRRGGERAGFTGELLMDFDGKSCVSRNLIREAAVCVAGGAGVW